jgi:AcrR family transcriptional regulator
LFRNKRYEMRGRQIRNPEARARVVEAAWRVVAAEGVHGATMRGIATEAGVTTGFVTHYFEDKQELLAAVLRFNNLRARDRVVAAIGAQRGLVALEGAVDALLPMDADRRRVWQVWIAAWRTTAGQERLNDEFRGGRRFVEGLFKELLAQAVADGELPATVDVAYEAEHLVTLIAGTGLIAGVESAARVRRAAKRMLAEQVARLERTWHERQGIET